MLLLSYRSELRCTQTQSEAWLTWLVIQIHWPFCLLIPLFVQCGLTYKAPTIRPAYQDIAPGAGGWIDGSIASRSSEMHGQGTLSSNAHTWRKLFCRSAFLSRLISLCQICMHQTTVRLMHVPCSRTHLGHIFAWPRRTPPSVASSACAPCFLFSASANFNISCTPLPQTELTGSPNF